MFNVVYRAIVLFVEVLKEGDRSYFCYDACSQTVKKFSVIRSLIFENTLFKEGVSDAADPVYWDRHAGYYTNRVDQTGFV
jgi:hypothetical protein